MTCAGYRFVCSHTFTRWTPKRLAIDMVLSPVVFAVRIASTSLSAKGVRDHLAGVATTPGPGSATGGSSLAPTRLASSHAKLSRSSRFHVFGLSPPASTIRADSGSINGFVMFNTHFGQRKDPYLGPNQRLSSNEAQMRA